MEISWVPLALPKRTIPRAVAIDPSGTRWLAANSSLPPDRGSILRWEGTGWELVQRVKGPLCALGACRDGSILAAGASRSYHLKEDELTVYQAPTELHCVWGASLAEAYGISGSELHFFDGAGWQAVPLNPSRGVLWHHGTIDPDGTCWMVGEDPFRSRVASGSRWSWSVRQCAAISLDLVHASEDFVAVVGDDLWLLEEEFCRPVEGYGSLAFPTCITEHAGRPVVLAGPPLFSGPPRGSVLSEVVGVFWDGSWSHVTLPKSLRTADAYEIEVTLLPTGELIAWTASEMWQSRSIWRSITGGSLPNRSGVLP